MNVDESTVVETQEDPGVIAAMVTAAEIADRVLEQNDEMTIALKADLDNPEKREAVLLSLVQNSTNALIAIDKQFSELITSIQALLRGHNGLVDRFNQTINNPRWTAGIVDQRITDREKLAHQESDIVELKSKMRVVHFGEMQPLQVGQISAFIRYPGNPQSLTMEELDTYSYNAVFVKEDDEEPKAVLKTENVVLYSAASLLLSEVSTNKTAEGVECIEIIKTLDDQDYPMLKFGIIIEIPGTSVE